MYLVHMQWKYHTLIIQHSGKTTSSKRTHNVTFCMNDTVQIILPLFSREQNLTRLTLNGHAEAEPVVQENG